MRESTIWCDRCLPGKKTPAIEFTFTVDRQMDGAGDTDDVQETVALCDECRRKQLMLFIYALPWELRAVRAKSILKCKRLFLSDTPANRGQAVFTTDDKMSLAGTPLPEKR